MGLMDSMKETVMGEAASRFSQITSQHPIASQLLTMYGGGDQAKGLSELVGAFQQNGLGAIVNSWVGTGTNLPLNSDHIEQALGQERHSHEA